MVFPISADRCYHAHSFRVARIPPIMFGSGTTGDLSPAPAVDLLALEHKGRRLDILIEGIRRIGKPALCIRAVIELHGHIKHHEVRGGHASA